MDRKRISIVIPCYKSENSIDLVVKELLESVKNTFDYEIVLVNDNSPDQTWGKISDLAKKDDRIKAISLAKNCGQHSAILTGMRYTTGDYTAVIDDDGQTPVEYISSMVEKIVNEGWDVVCADYDDRGRNSVFRDLGSFLAVRMSKWLLNEPDDVAVSVFFVAKRFVIAEIVRYDQPYPYLAGLLLRTTSRITSIKIDQRRRLHGKSGYSFWKLISLWLNGFTAFSVKPLRLTSCIGIIAAFFGFILAIITVIRKIMGVGLILGWSSVISVILILGGCILLELGLLGEYIGRIYLSINLTPQSVIRETVNTNDGLFYIKDKGIQDPSALPSHSNTIEY